MESSFFPCHFLFFDGAKTILQIVRLPQKKSCETKKGVDKKLNGLPKTKDGTRLKVQGSRRREYTTETRFTSWHIYTSCTGKCTITGLAQDTVSDWSLQAWPEQRAQAMLYADGFKTWTLPAK